MLFFLLLLLLFGEGVEGGGFVMRLWVRVYSLFWVALDYLFEYARTGIVGIAISVA